jgi:hypothetical protein
MPFIESSAEITFISTFPTLDDEAGPSLTSPTTFLVT